MQNTSSFSLNQLSDNKKLALAGAFASETDLIVYPLETIAKKAQFGLPEAAAGDTAGILTILKSPKAVVNQGLFKGVGAAGLNKLCSRSLRYPLQDIFQDKLLAKLGPMAESAHLDDQQTKTILGATSGVGSAAVETTLLYPLDYAKSRSQLNLAKSFPNMFQGYNTALVRNVMSAALFFGSFNFFKSKQTSSSSARNNLVATTGAALTTTVLTNPIEVVKTRVQGAQKAIPLKQAVTSVMQEGPRALMKGLLPRLLQTPAKVVLPFFAFNLAKDYFGLQQHNDLQTQAGASSKSIARVS